MNTPTAASSSAHVPHGSQTNGQHAHAGSQGPSALQPSDTFIHRHIAPSEADIAEMLGELGYASLDAFTDAVVPEGIRVRKPMALGHPRAEHELLNELHAIASQNQVFRSYIGTGYSDCITPPVIQRNILENPGWYTQYTPYQAEIAQGRLEALLNFQTLVCDLTAMPLAGASLLDEGTAAAEAMAMCFSIAGGHDGADTRKLFVIAQDCHPQTIAVVQTRARYLGVDTLVTDIKKIDFAKHAGQICGVLAQYPATDGRVECYEQLAKNAHAAGAQFVVACDLLALTLLKAPGEFGADIAVGSAQRFGVPMGFGGPHAAFIATRPEHARRMPGRLIGVSKDAQGNTALRMAIQTREQHIKRDKATSNICTAQALLAIMASMYAVYHGPDGLRKIAQRIRAMTQTLRVGLLRLGHHIGDDLVFDTLRVKPAGRAASAVLEAARARRMNLRDFGDGTLGVSLDETTSIADLRDLLAAFGGTGTENITELASASKFDLPPAFARQSGYLTHPIFNSHHSEHELLRYIFTLMGRDLSMAHSMIPLGSCTMKLNATSEMLPVTWAHFGKLHPFAPSDQTKGYQRLFRDLETWLAEITGFAAVSLQPNAGAQGEYAGLLVIRAYHESRGDHHRIICLIPDSAHGTNPASAVIAGFKVVPVKCDGQGNVDIPDLKAKALLHAKNLGALMVTYPSTHGVFEAGIKEITSIVHAQGGQVYMDGANMNAQVGLTSPGAIGADVCHLNLHKTFCIPHGGGGPGMGPIGVAAHLAPFLPGHPVVSPNTSKQAIGPVSAAPWGSASILTISWVYIALMGAEGLKKATQVAMLNANYMAHRLHKHFGILYTGQNGLCAHEFILDCRPFDVLVGIKTEDLAKRLMDYGFHAPTMSWPVPGTLMVEPTESEPKGELDRFCDAMISIREEISRIERGEWPKDSNPLKHAPHTAGVVTGDTWDRPYSRQVGAFPAAWVRDHKFWPFVARIDNAFGDRNLVCTCPPMAEYAN